MTQIEEGNAMKGLVLAGGAGTRLRPLTHTGAKQLVPVANRPVLMYVIDNLVDAGIRDIGIIISPETGREIKASLGDGAYWHAKFTFILQDKPAGLAHAVATARPFLDGADFVMYLGDNLIGTMIRDSVHKFQSDQSITAAVMLKEVQNPSAFGVAEVDDTGKVTRLVEKPKEPKSNLALVGVYMFRPSIFEAIAQIKPSPRGELEITDAISKLIELGGKVQFNRLTSWWLDTGKKDDLLIANQTVLDDWLKPEILGEVDAESQVVGRVRVDKGARIERSIVRGPVTIGKDALISDSRIGPFTAIGDRVNVTRSNVEHSVIMEESRIIDVGRLEDSLIGKRVVVRPCAPRQGALSLMVGDDCVVELNKD
jgi:glucose-1-phosphate thymidylyltransferase